ncbi:MAG TPA: hypothetical protein VH500_08060 [Nitrososphaeraceae archaeon]
MILIILAIQESAYRSKRGFRKGRDISQSRAIYNLPKYPSIRRQGANIQTKVQELEELNQLLRQLRRKA